MKKIAMNRKHTLAFLSIVYVLGLLVGASPVTARTEEEVLRDRRIKNATKLYAQAKVPKGKKSSRSVGGFSIQGARDFVTLIGDRMVQLLQEKGLSRSQQEAKYRRILDDHFDMRRAGLYVLGGRLARTAPSHKVRDFIELFTQITVENYVDKFNKYQGQTLKLLNREVIRGDSLVVYSEITQPNGTNIDVQWYISHKNGRLVVKDLKVEGLSLRQTSKKNYSATLRQGMDAGIARLQKELSHHNRLGNG